MVVECEIEMARSSRVLVIELSTQTYCFDGISVDLYAITCMYLASEAMPLKRSPSRISGNIFLVMNSTK